MNRKFSKDIHEHYLTVQLIFMLMTPEILTLKKTKKVKTKQVDF